MLTPSKLGLPAASWHLVWLLLLGTATAVPAEPSGSSNLAIRDDIASSSSASATPTRPEGVWVTVNEDGKPTTLTPGFTTIDGKPTIVSDAPYILTGTIFTTTIHMDIQTHTGAAAQTARKPNGPGAFMACQNPDPAFEPFCLPANDATVHTGVTYYVTWDPTYFKNTTNTIVNVKGFYDLNATDQAFASGSIDAGWGFYQWPVSKDLLAHNQVVEANITIQMTALAPDTDPDVITGPMVRVIPKPKKKKHTKYPPSGKALYIGLPSFFGFFFIVVIGISLWNRRIRRLGFGNVMSRTRHGYSAIGSRRDRLFGGNKKNRRNNKEESIGLMDREEDGNGSTSFREQQIY
ncbi:hypothetical protein B0H66DRAFT_542727 [Apodospora peruviana]|uniref:Uncharacterized protein n=1 Tax=Apodospora peruviana TaxID=516989 RepID=A0AAE0IS00_9PEZI|nr:hypothetical protein B0H66DRAFT_542727 [Apodospora peruviana]